MNEQDRNILLQLHFNGYWGKSGNYTKGQRLEKLNSLIDRGYLDNNGNLTLKANQELRS